MLVTSSRGLTFCIPPSLVHPRSAEELKKVMKHEPPERIVKYIEEYDLDKDGTINYEEFMRMLLPKVGRLGGKDET
jgi:hypothetical protein